MGAKQILATEDPEDMKKYNGYFDLIVCTTYQDNMQLDPFVSVSLFALSPH